MAAGAAFGLCDFIFVMREDQIAAATMEVECIAQIVGGHGRAFDVPARASLAPRAFPEWFAGLCRFPKCKVSRISLFIIDFDAGAGQHIFDLASGKLAVVFECRNVIVNIAAKDIGMPLLDQCLHHIDDVLHVIGHSRIHIGTTDMELIHDFKVRINVTIGDRFPVAAFRIGFIDDLIIDIREILYKGHFITDEFQIATDDIPSNSRTGIADMRMVVGSDSADVDLRFSFFDRMEYFFFFCQCVIYLDLFHKSLLFNYIWYFLNRCITRGSRSCHLLIFTYRNHGFLLWRLKQLDVFGKQKPPPHRDGGPLFHSVGRSRAKCFYRKHITEKDTCENTDRS